MACAEDKEIGEIAPLSPDYTLPQGKSPADDRIVELHSQYGTYILYEYSQLDFVYGFSTSYSYLYTLPDPQYVGDMLDLPPFFPLSTYLVHHNPQPSLSLPYQKIKDIF